MDYKKYYVNSYYGVAGEEQMKAEIAANGPIACGIEASANLEENYKGGIWRQYIKEPELNHEISVVGWRTDPDSQEQFWIVRNSWGNYWGDYGFFYLPIGPPQINLGLQTDCIAGVPDFDQAPGAKQILSEQSFIQ